MDETRVRPIALLTAHGAVLLFVANYLLSDHLPDNNVERIFASGLILTPAFGMFLAFSALKPDAKKMDRRFHEIMSLVLFAAPILILLRVVWGAQPGFF